MADVTNKITRTSLADGSIELMIESTEVVVGGTDTMQVSIADYGISTVEYVNAVVHTTLNSVIVAEAGTTALSAGVLTYTTLSGNDNKKRVLIVKGK